MKHNWEYKLFGSLCNIVRGGSPRPIQNYLTNSDDGLNWIKIGDVAAGSKYITSTKEKIKKEGLSKTRQVFKGEFILSNSMSFGRPYILKIDGCIHDGWLAIKGVENHFTPDFLYYYLSSPSTYSTFEKLVKGGVVSNLNSDIVKSIAVPVPPMEVQKQIVTELDKINEVIEDCRELLRNLDALAQSLFYDFFGDPVTNPKGWQTSLIKDILSLKAGKSIKASELIENPKEGYFPCYGGNGLRGYISKKSHSGLYNIIGRQGALCGNITFAEGEFYATEHAIVVSPLIDIYPRWLNYQFTIMNLNQYAKGVAQPGLSVSLLNELTIPIPPLSLQEKFAARIEQIEAQKKTVEETIANLQTLLDSRMDYWFN